MDAVYDDIVQTYVAALEQMRAAGGKLSFLSALLDHDPEIIKDAWYPCCTVDWLQTETPVRTGNMIERRMTLISVLYVGRPNPVAAQKQLRNFVGPWEQALESVKSARGEVRTYIYRPGPIKSGSRHVGGQHAAAALCEISAFYRGGI